MPYELETPKSCDLATDSDRIDVGLTWEEYSALDLYAWRVHGGDIEVALSEILREHLIPALH